MEPQGDLAMIGLAVMGQNIILNMNDHGFTVVAYNRTVAKVDEFLAKEAKGTKVLGAHSIAEMCQKLKKPRRIMMLVKAGAAVDEFIAQIVPHLEKGDIIIDGGNSLYQDTMRRCKEVESKGLLYIGTGVSGGEEGARRGPSIMPGGSPAAWPHVKAIFQGISAKVEGGVPCCDWVGEGGAGHYVKMVHNGIEYGDMQLICEAYQLMRDGLGLSASEMHDVFAEWNSGVLDSYLIEITRDILAFTEKDGTPLVDRILDTAGQKGTGKWTVIDSMELGIPITLIAEAVYSRCVSALKEERVAASKVLTGPQFQDRRPRSKGVHQLHSRRPLCLEDHQLRAGLHVDALGGEAIRLEFELRRNRSDVARRLHYPLAVPGQDQGSLRSRPRADEFAAGSLFQGRDRPLPERLARGAGNRDQGRHTGSGVQHRLAFYDSYRCGRLPANLLQAQRDYFGAHTYERVDTKRGEFHHTNWTGRGGDTSSSTYNVE
jgi:6-phosphogluconate dehydrogenase